MKNLGKMLMSRRERLHARFSHAWWHLTGAWFEIKTAFQSVFWTHPWDVFEREMLPSDDFPGYTLLQTYDDPVLGRVTQEGGTVARSTPPRCPRCFAPLGSCEHDPDDPFKGQDEELKDVEPWRNQP